ncbi:GDSL-type esterase/lipase family protein [Aestuariivivens insulae]|uniref:GDSL-type esterase/lipase family protein n=1 Tax=Aestuariivivens insulae TaxID=1621988 RepID=UPI001F5924F1|nr:GDSL-type esterase/lipase family protein [Aestuariivivens insulae]
MYQIKHYSILIITLLTAYYIQAQKIKVACIGDSVTFGLGIEDRNHNAYPAQLQELLGSTSYQVSNFGHSGATLFKQGHKPYWNTESYKKSLEFTPDIVIIHLGLNDQGNNNWPQHKEEFVTDYLELITIYKNLPSKPQVMICKMTPTFSGHHWFEEGMRESFLEIQHNIEHIAKTAHVALINLHEPLYRFPEYFPDNLHPTKEGTAIIAQKIYSAITGDYGGLKLPILYGEQMVLQRNKTINFNGTANYNDTITVEFNKQIKHTTAQFDGTWDIPFNAMKAGDPYPLKIYTKDSSIFINKVYIGEVWLASGQSNMAFKVSQTEHASNVLKDSLNDDVFIFSMNGKALSDKQFTPTELGHCNAGDYFQNTGWQSATKEHLGNFSAVAYAFAYNLQKQLQIPIGIICNAVGGSPTQSWVSRETMEQTHETIDLLNDTHLNPMVDTWVSQRIHKNLNGITKAIKARHPYQPTFLFDAGIRPLTNYPINGVIWYQGESNAEHVQLHSKLFNRLVSDWRHHWNLPELPFYYVQLSSINRPTWGIFRNSQRQLMEIPYTGMAVTLDVGHPTNVHPNKKWVVGTRLSYIALAKTYNINRPYSGPLFDYININNSKLEVHFTFSEGLKTNDGNPVRDIQIAGKDKRFVEAKAQIRNNVLIVWSEKIKDPRFVKYACSPYSQGNLVNQHDLPASTFTTINNE